MTYNKYSGVNNDKFYVDVTDHDGVGAVAISRVNEELSFLAREKVYEEKRDLLTYQFRFNGTYYSSLHYNVVLKELKESHSECL